MFAPTKFVSLPVISWWCILTPFCMLRTTVNCFCLLPPGTIHRQHYVKEQQKQKQHHQNYITYPLSLTLYEKRRRRRKENSNNGSTSDSIRDDSDELPDFDLNEALEIDAPSNNQVPHQQPSTSKSNAANTSNDPLGEISINMMGSSMKPVRSVNDLLRDRSLESKLQFDTAESMDGEELPDLISLAQQARQVEQQTGLPSMKKRLRQEARDAATTTRAQQRKKTTKEDTTDTDTAILSKIPFIRDENGKISPIKILENGTWACIGLLVTWELYINSPFFERAAPMVPIVYELYL